MSEPRCWLCERPLGRRVEWHHPVPKAKGGRETVPLHPICHRAIHARFDNGRLQRMGADLPALRADPDLAAFLRWIAGKAPDFTRRPAGAAPDGERPAGVDAPVRPPWRRCRRSWA